MKVEHAIGIYLLNSIYCCCNFFTFCNLNYYLVDVIKLQNWRKFIENHLPSTIYYTLQKGQILNETWELQKLELHPPTRSRRTMLRCCVELQL